MPGELRSARSWEGRRGPRGLCAAKRPGRPFLSPISFGRHKRNRPGARGTESPQVAFKKSAEGGSLWEIASLRSLMTASAQRLLQ